MNKSLRARRKVLAGAAAATLSLAVAHFAQAQSESTYTKTPPHAQTQKSRQRRDTAAANRFSARVDVALSNPAASKGEWGLLIADATTGETLYALNEDKYFVPLPT